MLALPAPPRPEPLVVHVGAPRSTGSGKSTRSAEAPWVKSPRTELDESTLSLRARELTQDRKELEELRLSLEVREGRLVSREEALKTKENSFAQRLRDTRNQYRAECVTLTTRLSYESDQLRNEASLLRQAQQSEQDALLVAQKRLQSETLQSEGTVLSEELHLGVEESHLRAAVTRLQQTALEEQRQFNQELAFLRTEATAHSTRCREVENKAAHDRDAVQKQAYQEVTALRAELSAHQGRQSPSARTETCLRSEVAELQAQLATPQSDPEQVVSLRAKVAGLRG